MNLKMGFSRKRSTPNFPKNEYVLPPNMYVRVVSGGKKYSFLGKCRVLSFLDTPVLRFALLPYYYRRYYVWILLISMVLKTLIMLFSRLALIILSGISRASKTLSFLIFQFFDNYLLTSSFTPLIVL